jgi:hypothetical protein
MQTQILVRHGPDLKAFREEILPAGRPVVLKDLVKDWPAVRAGRDSPRALADYLRGFDRGKQVAVLEGPPSIRGHFFYRDDMRGMNFERRPATISATIERLLAQASDPNPAALYIESTPTSEHLPAFAGENVNPLLPPAISPRVWIGNTLVVQTHFDLSSNIACVVGGRRRFTLFPPGQLPNLYVGPIEFNISGPPISMVSLRNPDFARFPRFAEALAASQVAELTPGTRSSFLLGGGITSRRWSRSMCWPTTGGTTRARLAHRSTACCTPSCHCATCRRAARGVAHAVRTLRIHPGDESMAHLPREQRGMLGPPSPERAQAIRAILAPRAIHAIMGSDPICWKTGLTPFMARSAHENYEGPDHEAVSRRDERRTDRDAQRLWCGGGDGSFPPPSGGGGGGGGLPPPSSAPALKTTLAAKYGVVDFPVGAAIEPSSTTNSPDRDILLKHYSSITAENAMKPTPSGPTRPAPGRHFAAATPQLRPGDTLAAFAFNNGMQLRGHTLLWHQTAPTWFFAGDPVNDPVSYRINVQQRLRDYIFAWSSTSQCLRLGRGQRSGQRHAFDANPFRTNSVWYLAYGVGGGDPREYVRDAFLFATQARDSVGKNSSNMKLMLNDYNTELAGKRDNVLRIVQYVMNAATAPTSTASATSSTCSSTPT